ncbi:MAG: GtrA family protein [archaeon]
MTLKEQESKKNNYRFTKSLLIKKRTSFLHKIYYSLVSIPLIYKYKTKLKYVSLGFFGEIVDFLLLFILTSFLNVYYLLSTIIAYVAGMFVNFNLHKNYTFKYNTTNLWKNLFSFFKYTMISITGLVVTVILMGVFVEFIGMHYLLAKLVAGMIAFSINYYGHSYILSHQRFLN